MLKLQNILWLEALKKSLHLSGGSHIHSERGMLLSLSYIFG